MANRLLNKVPSVDAFISSPARRAKNTAEIFAQQFNSTNIIYVDGLYHATSYAYPEIIAEIEENYNTVVIFSHNPGITDFVNSLTKTIRTDNVPTCGMFGVRLKIEHWNEFGTSKKEFLFYDYPKLGR
jgi:phosphohistidine phosphatase